MAFSLRRIGGVGSSFAVSKKTVDKFICDPDFPYFVSFPRTGSHWVRMLMELYFKKPSLVRVFYYKNTEDFLCYHTHDMDLDIYRNNVIYLYRDPVSTIYSQMCYHKVPLNNEQAVSCWADLYGRHLHKWLIEDSVSKKKTILQYERMMTNTAQEFEKVSCHFEQAFNTERFEIVKAHVSKAKLQKLTKHDQQVVNLTLDYQDEREIFIERYKTVVLDVIAAHSSELNKYFD